MRDRILASVSAALLALAAPAAGQPWMPGPSFPEAPQPRLQGAAVVYHGLIYDLGGSPFDATALRNGITDYFDGTSLVQGPVLDGPFVSQGAGVDSLGRAVIFGGWTGPNGDVGGAYLFDPVEGAGAWVPSRSSLAPPANFAWTTDGQGRIYSIGGGPGESASTSRPNSTCVERYSASANAWAVLSPLPAAISNAAAVEDGLGHVLVIGGINATGTSRVNAVLSYDIATDTWSSNSGPPLPVDLSNARAVHGTDQRVYVIGGATGPIGSPTPSAAVWVLDQRTNSWSAGPAMSTPRSDPAVVLDPNISSIYAMGGDDGHGGSYTTESLAISICPIFYSVAQSETLGVGRTVAFAAVAAADTTTINYQWRHNGAPLADGTSATGSLVSGSATTLLTLTSIAAADAGTYEVIASNACGSVTSPPASLVVTPVPLLPGAANWTALSAAFGQRNTSFNAISGGVISGGDEYRRTSNPAAGSYFFHGLSWDGFAGDPTTGFPIGTGIGSDVFGAAGPLSVGYYQYLISEGRGGLGIQKQGAIWATVDGKTTLTGTGFAIPMATYGHQIVGTNGTSAFVWNAPSPAGPWSSIVLGAGFASAVANGKQYGSSYGHAAIWSSYVRTDVNPPIAIASELFAASGEDQSGDFTTDVRHAGLWHGQAAVTDLSPTGSDSSSSTAMSGSYAAGNAYFGGVSHAVIWGGSAAQEVDLGAVAGASFASTWVKAMEVDSVGNLAVVGGGVRASDGLTLGLIWTTAPYAEIFRQPVSASVVPGGPAAFAVVARGNGGVIYQWRHDGIPLADGARITGSQTARLGITNAQPGDEGLYDVEVSNALRSTDSAAETLTVIGVTGLARGIPVVTRFAGARPEPVHGRAVFSFDLAHQAQVRLRLYDVSGRLVRTLADDLRPAGHYEIPWSSSGSARPAGLYLALFEADGVKETHRVVVTR